MTTFGDLDRDLENVIHTRGEDLRALAVIVLSRLEFLRHVVHRQKTIRTDQRVTTLGIGVAEDAREILNRNLNLVAHLLRQALILGDRTNETYTKLAECLYELGQDSAAIAVVDNEKMGAAESLDAQRIRAKALLACGDATALDALAGLSNADAGSLRRIEIIDHCRFEVWAERAGADLVPISEGRASRKGEFRFCTAEQIHEFDDTLATTPLLGARKHGLEIYGGFLPVANACGYYHEDALPTVRDAPMTVEVARNAFAYDAAMARRIAFRGRYLVPCAPHRYFAQYSHGIIQIYARLVATIRTGQFDDHRILLPQSTPDWVVQLLQRAGIDSSRIERMPVDAICEVEDALILPMNWAVSPYEIRELRAALRLPNPNESDRVNYYLTRGRSVKNFHRIMVNEDEFIAICEARGFVVIDPMDYSIEQQIELFSKAGTIVTSDSSADTNMIYAPSGAEVIIIIPGRFTGMLMIDVAIACGHTMSVVIGEFLADKRDVDHSSGPYHADPELLAALLDRLGITGSAAQCSS